MRIRVAFKNPGAVLAHSFNGLATLLVKARSKYHNICGMFSIRLAV